MMLKLGLDPYLDTSNTLAGSALEYQVYCAHYMASSAAAPHSSRVICGGRARIRPWNASAGPSGAPEDMLAAIHRDLLSSAGAGDGGGAAQREELLLHFMQPYIEHWQRLVHAAQ